MKFGRCKCGRWTLLTRHSKVGGHAEGFGYEYLCRECHDKEHDFSDKRINVRFQKGSGGKYAKNTRRDKRKK